MIGLNEDFIGIITNAEGVILGTGFVVDTATRLVATAYHVIRSHGVEDLRFQLFNNPQQLLVNKIVASQPKGLGDLAVLEVEQSFSQDIQVPELISDVPFTSEITIIGNGGNEDKLREYRSVTGTIAGKLKKWGETSYYHITINNRILKGMSGSPVIIPSRGIVGILIERGLEGTSMQDQAVVVPINYLTQLDPRIPTPRSKYLNRLITHLTQQSDYIALSEYVEIPVELRIAADSESQTEPFESVFQLPQHLSAYIVIGAPGSGKTATLRALAAQVAQNALKSESAKVPIWISLADYRDHVGSFVEFLENQILKVQRMRFGSLVHPEALAHFIDNQNFHYFFDGLEEIESSAALNKFQEWVATQTHVVISCRELNFTSARHIKELPVVRIRPLSTSAVYKFAAKYFHSNQKADSFVSQVMSAESSEDTSQRRLGDMARIPFLLMLILSASDNSALQYTSNQWMLFEAIVARLWSEKRIRNQLVDFKLEQKFSDVKVISRLLGQLSLDHLNKAVNSQYAMSSNIPSVLLDLLVSAGLLSGDTDSTYRFRHQLFSDYFLALEMFSEESNQSLRHRIQDAVERNLLSPLVILSSRGEAERQLFQSILLNKLLSGRVSQEVLWALGEIGDAEVISQVPFSTDTEQMKLLAVIANKLPDTDSHRVRLISYLNSMLKQRSGTGVEAQIRSELASRRDEDEDEQWDFLSTLDMYFAPEVLSYIKSPEIASLLVDTLFYLEEKTARQMMSGQFMRQQWFSVYLARQGEAAVPFFLQVLNENRNSDVSTTVSQALRMIDRPLAADTFIHLLQTNPNPMVRENAAYRLGADRVTKAVDALTQSLDDRGMYIRGGIMAGNSFHYVADSVALALAHIGSPDALSALDQHNYEYDLEKGEVTFRKAMLKRLDLAEDFDPYNPEVRTDLARIIASDSTQVDFLLSKMGRFNFVVYEGFRINDPVARAFIQRHNYSKSEDGLTRSKARNYIDISPYLLDYLGSSPDVIGWRWALIVIAHTGERALLPQIIELLNSHPNAEFREAVLYAAFTLISRFATDLSDQNILVLLEHAVITIRYLEPKLQGGIGLGLKAVATILKRDYPERWTSLVSELGLALNESSTNASRVALDVFASLNDELEDNLPQRARNNPLYYLQEANEIFWDCLFKERSDYMYDAWQPDWKRCIAAYRQVLTLKRQSTLGINEGEWISLGCSDVLIHHHIGRAYGALEDWHSAHASYAEAYRSYVENREYFRSQSELLRMVAFSLREAGNILHNLIGTSDLDQVERYYSAGIQLSEVILDQALLFDLLDRQTKLLDDKGEPEQLIVSGQRALALLTKVQEYRYGFFDEEVEIRVRLSRAYFALDDFELGLEILLPLEEKARHLQKKRLLASTLISIAGSQLRLGKSENFETKLAEARKLLEEEGEWAAAAYTIQMGVSQIDTDSEPDKALPLLALAMSYVDRSAALYSPDQKAQIFHAMSNIHFEQERYDAAQKCSEQAVALLRPLNMPFELMQVLTQYGLSLHRNGNQAEARAVLSEVRQLLSKLQIPPSPDIQMALLEVFIPTGLHLPSFWVDEAVNNVVAILHGDKDSEDIGRYLLGVLAESNRQGWHSEAEFVQALLKGMLHQAIEISTQNPYAPAYLPILTLIKEDESILQKILNVTLEIMRTQPEKKALWREQVFLLAFRAFLQSSNWLHFSLRGIYEFLLDSEPETQKLDTISINVIQQLRFATQGKQN